MLATAAGPSFADTGAPAPAAAAGTKPTGAQQGPSQQAQAEAKKTGKPVTVDALTTETSLTVANPDGSFTTTTNVQAARVKKGGAWVATDATLAKNADGTFSPAATPSGVTLSGGGTAPLAAFKDKAGHQFAMTLPFALPKPTVNGDTATYADVLPGVDLQATVTDQGAFHEVLVVKNAQAAANPQLKTLKLATTTNGLTTSTDTDGNLTVKTPDGTEAFHAPAPLMWDSASQAAPAADSPHPNTSAAEAAPKLKAISPDAPAAPLGFADPAGKLGSSKEGPGHGAHISKLNVTADNGSLTLAPDADQLAHATYPAFIDPGVSPAGGTNHYTEVKSGCAGQTLYDTPQTNGEAIGWQHYDSNCAGIYRSFYELNTSFLNSSMTVFTSTLVLSETYGADWNCSTQYPVNANLVGAINGSTSWNTQPGWVQSVPGTTTTSSASSCGTHTVNLDVTNAVKSYQTNGNLTFQLYGNEDTSNSSNNGFMRFGLNPYISTTYDIAPNQPTGMYTSPYAGECGNTGWIGMTSLNGNASNIQLHAWDSTNMPGVNLQSTFHVWDNMTSNGGSPAGMAQSVSDWTAPSSWTSANIAFQVQDGHQYGWNAIPYDGTLNGPGSQYCYFDVDLSPPSIAGFTPSAAFPPLGSGITPQAHAGDPTVNIQVSSTDPTPTGCTLNACIKSGVKQFQWALDQNIPVSGFNHVDVTPDANGTATASIPVSLTANQWGTHTLNVRAVDGAGNTQATVASYSFYAPFNPNTKVNPGDLTGDGVPDTIVADPTNTGNLTLIPGNADASATPQVASTQANSPDGTSWSNFLVTHRGSEVQGTVDDIFALKNTSPKSMYLYTNDGNAAAPAGGYAVNGTFDNRNFQPLNKPSGCAAASTGCSAAYSASWDAVSQMVAPGAFSRLPLWSASGSKPYADLITVENGKLWYYPGSAKGGANLVSPYLISSDDWSNTTLIAPGLVGATVTNGAVSGGTPTLWARNNTTGAVNQYTLTFDTNGLPTSNLSAPKATNLTNGAGTNLCADVSGGNTANGTAVALYGCGSTMWENQGYTWGLDGSLHVLGKCIDIPGSSTTAGTAVQLYDCNTTNAQKWAPVAGSPGLLQNPNSGLCLAAAKGNPTASGAALVIATCAAGTPEQTWTATGTALTQQSVINRSFRASTYPVLTSPGDVNNDGNPDLVAITGAGAITQYLGTGADSKGEAQLSPASQIGTVNAQVQVDIRSVQDGRCLDNYGNGAGVPGRGTNVAQYDCWGGATQKFTFATDGTLRTGGMCVSVANGATTNGAAVISWDCEPGHAEQQWVLGTDGTIRNPASKKCLELPGWVTTNGSAMDIWDCGSGQANQEWVVHTY
ncbi:ricin-type beta-trefoil lectin domain protein [Kitasatospora sp. NPDC058965]|uniref:ricin-type beta-trefoil lectin domain protein n=1 Tax=Kitasatospora sp. NPDC058965 TaxID=3346682 RepID=UPI0036C5552B